MSTKSKNAYIMIYNGVSIYLFFPIQNNHRRRFLIPINHVSLVYLLQKCYPLKTFSINYIQTSLNYKKKIPILICDHLFNQLLFLVFNYYFARYQIVLTVN